MHFKARIHEWSNTLFVNFGKILFLVASFRDTGVNPTDKKDNSRSGYTGVEEVEEVH